MPGTHFLPPPVLLDEWPSDDPRTRLVFITRDVGAEGLRSTLTLLTEGIKRYDLEGLVSGLLPETPALQQKDWR